jgi:hypothetical protein
MPSSGKAWQRATSINVKAMAPAAHIIAANLHFSHIDHAMGSAIETQMAVCQNLVPLVNIKIAGKWMFIPLKIVLIGIDP